jgi:hypothetical protein
MQANSPSFLWSLLQHIQKVSSSKEEEYDEDVVGKRMLDGNARPRRVERRSRDDRTCGAGKVEGMIGDEETCSGSQFAKWLARRGLPFGSLGASVFLIGEFDLKICDFDQ